MIENKINFRLHIISPVHIGCDEVYEPSSFKIDEQRRKLIEFDKYKFYESLPNDDKKRFLNICSRTDLSAIIELIRFISQKAVSGKEIDISSGVLSSYIKLRQLDPKNAQQISKFEIKRTAFNPLKNEAFIPGSSLKGSLRTGYLNDISHKKSHKAIEKAKDLEQYLLNYRNFEEDPFKLIKVSDFLPIENVKTKIIYAINKKKTGLNKGRGIPVILETICENSIFEGSIIVSKNFNSVKEAIDIKNCLSANHKFYYNLLTKEDEVLRKIQASTRILNSVNKAFGNKLNDTAFCIRIGRHSGAEAVTIDSYRKILIRGPKGKRTEQESSTIWLASDEAYPTTNNNLVPFGWCILEIAS